MHEYLILSKFRNDRVDIVDFLIKHVFVKVRISLPHSVANIKERYISVCIPLKECKKNREKLQKSHIFS